MKDIVTLQFRGTSREELLPGFEADFPCIASRTHLTHTMPWHWHKELELFYVESGALEYMTPGGKTVFPAGSGGLVNANVLHTTSPCPGAGGGKTVQLLYLFDPSLVAGTPGGRIEKQYVAPLVNNPAAELLVLQPGNPAHAEALQQLYRSFCLNQTDAAYELRLRGVLSALWVPLLALCPPQPGNPAARGGQGDKIKQMMVYIHEHYPEKLTTAQIAAAAYISERECFRAFREALQTTPMAYLRDWRLQQARLLLEAGRQPVTEIGHRCGLGSSSYFAKIFHGQVGCTPLAYRQHWQDCVISGQSLDSFGPTGAV